MKLNLLWQYVYLLATITSSSIVQCFIIPFTPSTSSQNTGTSSSSITTTTRRSSSVQNLRSTTESDSKSEKKKRNHNIMSESNNDTKDDCQSNDNDNLIISEICAAVDNVYIDTTPTADISTDISTATTTAAAAAAAAVAFVNKQDEETIQSLLWKEANFINTTSTTDTDNINNHNNSDTTITTNNNNNNNNNNQTPKRSSYLPWKPYFLAMAKLTSQRSKDPQNQVGACIVDSQNRILGKVVTK